MNKEINQMLAQLKELGYSQPALERILGLPMKTFDSLKRDKVREGIAILTIITNFPFVIKAAEAGFDEKESKRVMMHAAVDLMIDKE